MTLTLNFGILDGLEPQKILTSIQLQANYSLKKIQLWGLLLVTSPTLIAGSIGGAIPRNHIDLLSEAMSEPSFPSQEVKAAAGLT
jgi:hypothetical protein